jgi:Na+/H+ antiporter NhaD/arsenite permease-like protein
MDVFYEGGKNMNLAQILALILFIAMFILIVMDKIERHHVTLACGILTLAGVFGLAMRSMDAITETLNLRSIFTVGFWYTAGSAEESTAGINWATIIFIAGMMVMVEGMAESGFFRWLCMKLAKLVHYKPIPLFLTFMLMSAFLAMFIDSITVILFLAAVTIELAKLLKFDPVPMILSEIFCANLGGSATMCGDPPNIIIGTSLGYSFADFITNTGLIAAISLILIVVYYFLVFRKELAGEKLSQADVDAMPDPKEAITNKMSFAISTLIFLCAVVLLVTHAQTGLTVAFIGTVIALVTLVVAGPKAIKLLKKVDYKTLLFFIGLFMVVGGLEQTGILEIIAGFIGNVSHGNLHLMVAIILWVSAIASAFVDNIPFAATMIPVIKSLAATQGVDLSTLAWALSMGTDIGGSATPIGASANVVGTSVATKNGYLIGWGKYCKSAAPATVIVILVSMVFIFIRYC